MLIQLKQVELSLELFLEQRFFSLYLRSLRARAGNLPEGARVLINHLRRYETERSKWYPLGSLQSFLSPPSITEILEGY